MGTTGRSDYQDRRDEKRDRLEGAAAKAERASKAGFKGAMGELAGIPPGQPILVGHHSEKRHRATLARHDSKMGRAVEDGQRAKDLSARASGMDYAGISGDDPDALELLAEKLAGIKADHAAKKAANAAVRKAAKAAGLGRSGGQEANQRLLETLRETVPAPLLNYLAGSARAFPWLPQFDLGLINANRKRVEGRIAELAARSEWVEREPIKGEGWTVFEDLADNRVCVSFPVRVSKDTTGHLRRLGFVWSRTDTRWQRQLNNAGRNAASAAAEWLGRKEVL